MTELSESWLASRRGVDPLQIEGLRRAGELIAVRPANGSEWRYPSWQFASGGETKPGVARFLAAARDAGFRGPELTRLLDRRVGLVDSTTVLDLLRSGREDAAVASVRALG
jgi:hypothetical protein